MNHHREPPAHPVDSLSPKLERVVFGEVVAYVDEDLRAREGIVVAFTERTGGESVAPYDSLNLATHVGDDPVAVNENRTRVLGALGMTELADRLVSAVQVHGDMVAVVDMHHAGSGAMATGLPPVPSTDALVTTAVRLPILMCYADCVPVILVASTPMRGVAVVHAGWRGALVSLPGRAVEVLAEQTGASPASLRAYIGPHIGPCCYEVGTTILSQFCNNFDTIGAVDGQLDLAAAVRESLTRSGVALSRIAQVGVCTRDHTDRFFSYRASATTGRHGALAVITEGE